jgi:putative hydrolase of the HAD superfamily
MVIKAVFFDMGGTIDTYRFTRQYRIANMFLIRGCLARAGITLEQSDEQLTDAIARGVSAYLRWNRTYNLELKPADIWSRYFFKGMDISAQALEPVAEELAFLYEARLFIREPRPDAKEVLEKIKGMGLKVGCISNTQSATQVPASLKEYGLIDYFDPLVLSSQYGRRKPDPSIFYYAARLAKVPTGACVYVGDKINRDILGARRAGYRLAVQIRHEYDNGEKDAGASPDFIIHSLTELLPLLEIEMAKDRQSSAQQPGRNVKALFFDACDVLYHRPQRDQHLAKFLQGKQLNLPPNFHEERRRLKNLAYSGRIRRREYQERLLRLYGINSSQELAAGMSAMSLDDNTIEIIPGVPETLLYLKEKGYILGIITDTAMSFSKKLNWFEEHGFGRIWDAVISSKEIGVRKPSPEMYLLAVEQTGVSPAEAAFIGHRKTELDGARAVGLKTIAFNYEDGAVADVYIQNFTDLLTLPLLGE